MHLPANQPPTHLELTSPTRPPQISDKVEELLRLLTSCPDDATKTLTCLTLATRMVSQCDSQVGCHVMRGDAGWMRGGALGLCLMVGLEWGAGGVQTHLQTAGGIRTTHITPLTPTQTHTPGIQLLLIRVPPGTGVRARWQPGAALH